MATIQQVLDNAMQANRSARGVVVAIIEDHSDIITEFNKLQLKRGKNSDDTGVNPLYRSLFYSLEKNKMNPDAGFGTPDLLLTGAFYRGFYLSVNGMSFELSSSNSKTPDLVEKYGQNIFGLSSSSLSEYTTKFFFKEFKEFIEKTLKLQMK